MTDDEDKETTKEFHFDVLFVRRFYRLLTILFPRVVSIPSLLFLLLLNISLFEQFMIYWVGLIPSEFYKVLNEKSMDGFWTQAIRSFVLIVAISIVKSTRQYITSVLYLTWRQVLCVSVHRFYFSGVNFYKINVLDTTTDNPDQRITQDVDKMCSGFSTIFPAIIVFPFTVTYYTYQTYIGTGYLGPVGIFVFFLLSTIINKGLMSPIVALVFRQEKKEGDFRFKHLQTRVNCESLAFVGKGNSEFLLTNVKLNSLLRVQQKLVNRQYLLNCAVNLFDYVGSIISYLLLAIPIFNGIYDGLNAADLSALISKNAFVCIYLISTFSSVVDLSVKITDIAGNTHRIVELIEQLTQFNGEKEINDSSQMNNEDTVLLKENFIGFKLENVSFQAPGQNGRILLENFTMSFTAGTNILIMGKSGSGKTALIRVLRGFWPNLSGKIERQFPTGPSGVHFLPSKPFLTDGTLRQQIIYPLLENISDWNSVIDEDNVIKELLCFVGLSSLEEKTGGLDCAVTWNWYDKLSPGEIQRLCFARLFYHNPIIAVLDEATSAVSIEVENSLYLECRRRQITVISIGHRQSLFAYHHILIELDGNGGWTQRRITDSIQDDDN